jgi:hypothetical protein
MSHLAFIHTYPGANHDLRFLWPYFKANGHFDRVIFVTTEGGGCWWPDTTSHVEIGRDSYVAGDHLPRRLTETVEVALRDYKFDRLSISEYDVLFARPFVNDIPDDRMCGIRVGGQVQGCESHFFMHWPVSASRAVWEKWLPAARQLLKEGRIELGSPDLFLALACEVAGIEPYFDAWKGYSRNTIHGPVGAGGRPQADFIAEARKAYQDGVVVFHGVKSSKVYGCDVARTVQQITQ